MPAADAVTVAVMVQPPAASGVDAAIDTLAAPTLTPGQVPPCVFGLMVTPVGMESENAAASVAPVVRLGLPSVIVISADPPGEIVAG